VIYLHTKYSYFIIVDQVSNKLAHETSLGGVQEKPSIKTSSVIIRTVCPHTHLLLFTIKMYATLRFLKSEETFCFIYALWSI
jgi:hypothetical protein